MRNHLRRGALDIGCQSGIAGQINCQGGDYVLMLKNNQPKMLSAVRHHFDCVERDGFELLEHESYETLEEGHDRVEFRRYDVISDAAWLDPQKKWGGLCAIDRVRTERGVGEMVSKESRYYTVHGMEL